MKDDEELIKLVIKGVESCEKVFENGNQKENIYYTKNNLNIKSYQHNTFIKIREISGLVNSLFVDNLKINKENMGKSYGKSGAKFFFTENLHFVIKIIRKSEKMFLMKFLNKYLVYIEENPNSLLVRYFGCYRFKVENQMFYCVIMNNICPIDMNNNEIYDLKGSLYKRYISDYKHHKIMKDVEWKVNKRRLFLLGKRFSLLSQILKDTEFLKLQRAMDYSLLVGIKKCSNGEERIKPESIEKWPIISSNNVFSRDFGGYASEEIQNLDSEVYYIGIIDTLTYWNTIKKLESCFWSCSCNNNRSCIDPYNYSERFNIMVEEDVFYDTINNDI